MAYLRVQLEPGEAHPFTSGFVLAADGSVRVPLEKRTLVGRQGTCDVVVRSGQIAREDTVFEPDGAGWAAVNLGTNNGMFVNGKRVLRATLRDGDSIYLYAVTFVFVA